MWFRTRVMAISLSWNQALAPPSRYSSVIRKCFSEYWCLRGNETGDKQCREGHEGPMCGVQSRIHDERLHWAVRCMRRGRRCPSQDDPGHQLRRRDDALWPRRVLGTESLAFIHEKLPFLEDWHKHLTEFRVKAKILLVFFQIVRSTAAAASIRQASPVPANCSQVRACEPQLCLGRGGNMQREAQLRVEAGGHDG